MNYHHYRNNYNNYRLQNEIQGSPYTPDVVRSRINWPKLSLEHMSNNNNMENDGFINNLRRYRIKMDNKDGTFFNSEGKGIALFDLLGSFLIAFLIDYYFHISIYLKDYFYNPIFVYYLLVIPLGIVFHLIFSQKTFLNAHLFSKEMNFYKIIVVLILINIVVKLR